jgi:hypothetical protein
MHTACQQRWRELAFCMRLGYIVSHEPLQGEDCGPIETSQGKGKGEAAPVEAIKLENTLLRRFTGNLKTVNCLPARGANVLDILRHKYLIITEAGLRDLTLRLTRPLNRGFKPAGYDWQKMKDEEAVKVAQEKERRANLAEWIRRRGVLRSSSEQLVSSSTQADGDHV